MHAKEGTFGRFIFGEGHIKHHLEVLDDMKLVEDYDESGVIFRTKHLLLIVPIIYFSFSCNFKLFNYNLHSDYILLISVCVALFYKFMWDFLHTSFHQTRQIEKYSKNPIFRYFFLNHTYHHLVKYPNKGNYCIIFLGADHLLGTYNSCIDNKEYCKNPHKSHIDFCNKEINKIKLENGFKWC